MRACLSLQHGHDEGVRWYRTCTADEEGGKREGSRTRINSLHLLSQTHAAARGSSRVLNGLLYKGRGGEVGHSNSRKHQQNPSSSMLFPRGSCLGCHCLKEWGLLKKGQQGSPTACGTVRAPEGRGRERVRCTSASSRMSHRSFTVQPAPRKRTAPTPNRPRRRRSGRLPAGAARAMDHMHGHANSHVPAQHPHLVASPRLLMPAIGMSSEKGGWSCKDG